MNQEERILRGIGWYPGRRVEDSVRSWEKVLDQEGAMEMFEAARSALIEFGELRSNADGPGIDCAKSPFILDPTGCLGDGEKIGDFAERIGKRLYPLGESFNGELLLVMDEQGRVYELMDAIYFTGNDIREALVNLIVGRQAKEN